MKLRVKEIKTSNNKILFYVVLVIILIILIIIKNQNLVLKQNSKYTIGKLDKLITSKAADMKFYFYVNNTVFLSSGYTQDNSDVIIGGRYFVVFNDKNPSICEMFTKLPVPDSIRKAPYGGWDKLPIPEYQKYVDNYLEKATNNWFMRFIPPW